MIFTVLFLQLRICVKDELKDVFASAGIIERVKILPAREGRDITLA